MIVDCQQATGVTDILGIVLGAVTTMAAAYFGAKYAFRLQNKKDERAITAANITSADYAVFQLHRTINHFTAYRKQFLDQWRNDPRRHFLVRASLGDVIEAESYEFKSLAFLFKSEDPNILSELAKLEDDAKTIAAAIRDRTEIHGSQFQPIVEVMQMKPDVVPSLAELTSAVGPRISHTLKMATDQIVDGSDRIIQSAYELVERIKQQTEALFPGDKVIGTERVAET